MRITMPFGKARAERKAKAAEYLSQQKENLKAFKVGHKDNNGYTVKNIYARGDEYVIYDCEDAHVSQVIKVYLETKIEEDNTILKALNSVKVEFDKIKTVLYKSGDNPIHKQRAASAIVIALQEPKKAGQVNALLRKIAAEITKEYEDKLLGRLSYLSGALAVALIFSALSIVGHIYKSTDFIYNNHLLLLLVYCAGFASMGGFFSISLKTKSIFIMQAINKRMYFWHGVERAVIAVIAGIICFALLKSEIIFGNIKDGNTGIFFVMSACFLSGFSEKFIPNSLSTISKDDQ